MDLGNDSPEELAQLPHQLGATHLDVLLAFQVLFFGVLKLTGCGDNLFQQLSGPSVKAKLKIHVPDDQLDLILAVHDKRQQMRVFAFHWPFPFAKPPSCHRLQPEATGHVPSVAQPASCDKHGPADTIQPTGLREGGLGG